MFVWPRLEKRNETNLAQTVLFVASRIIYIYIGAMLMFDLYIIYIFIGTKVNHTGSKNAG